MIRGLWEAGSWALNHTGHWGGHRPCLWAVRIRHLGECDLREGGGLTRGVHQAQAGAPRVKLRLNKQQTLYFQELVVLWWVAWLQPGQAVVVVTNC